MDAGNGDRRRRVVRGTESSGRDWQVSGVNEVQVDGVLLQESRWGVGEKERGYTTKGGY